ncbi:hypothetical protein [Paenibacillus sp. 23TSA30-6]|uniref:hypothetical protein n=1 Tax=Paenibacillus sp. 23TSA30-6 TaxID=2546104 RepID=UPI00178819A2|nr:hypothetical protein [Paenibacillus sp. 23TSA30-6]MBE0339786.1 hypothetical protein [Paenibacillus sp. 23TSA30-6]
MGKAKVKMVIRFLKGMQAEKVNVLGDKEAKEDNELIQKVIEDIELFYEAELEGEADTYGEWSIVGCSLFLMMAI